MLPEGSPTWFLVLNHSTGSWQKINYSITAEYSMRKDHSYETTMHRARVLPLHNPGPGQNSISFDSYLNLSSTANKTRA